VSGTARHGIDGWLVDLANITQHEFWYGRCAFARTSNPDAFVIGEVATPFVESKNYLNGRGFCSVMNCRFGRNTEQYFISKSVDTDRFLRSLAAERNVTCPEIDSVMYNLLDSHDTERVSSLAANPGVRKSGDARDLTNYAFSEANHGFNSAAPTADQDRTVKLIVLFQMTYIEAPAILYGDETGLWGGVGSYKPMPWADRADPINTDMLECY